MKKVFTAVLLLVLIVVGAAAAALLIVDPKSFVEAKKDEAAKQASERLGRALTVGTVTASVFPKLAAKVEGIFLAAADPAAAPQAQVHSIDVELDLWKAVFTFGRVLEVNRVVINGLNLRAARDAEGRWDFADILRRLDEQKAKEPPTDEEPADLAFLKGAKVARFSIYNSRVDLDDKALGRPLAVTGLTVDVSDVVLGDPLVVALKAVLEDGAKQAPIDVGFRLDQLPEDLDFDPLPDASVDLKVANLDLSGWGQLLPPDAPAPVWGTVTTDLHADSKKGGNEIGAKGTLALRAFQLRDKVSAVATPAELKAAPRGQPLDVDVDLHVGLDRAAPRYTITKLTVKGGGLDVAATLDAAGTSLADLAAADVKADVADLGRVLAVLPPSMAALPAEVMIEGPLSARLTGNATEVTAAVDLDKARVRYATDFDKAAGRPLNLKLHGAKQGKVLHVDTFALVVDTAKIGGTLDLPVEDGAPLAADITSGPISLASLQGIIPPFAAAMGKGKSVNGTIEVKAKATAQGDQQLADVSLAMTNLDLDLDRTTAKGSGTIHATAAPAGETLKIVVAANFDGLSVVSLDESGAKTLDKAMGLPLRLDIDATKGKSRADIASAKVAIGKSTILGKGAVTGLDGKSPTLDLDVGNIDFAFDDLRAAVPGAAKLPAGGRFKAAVKVNGAPEAMSTLIVDAKNVDVAFGSSRLAGDVRVKNLDKPDLTVDLTTINLAFDDVRALSESAGDLPAGGRFQGALKMRGDTARDETVDVNVTVGLLEVPGSRIKGTVALKSLETPRFNLDLKADSLDLDALSGDSDEKDDAPKAKRENPHGLSKSTRELLAKVSGTGTLKADKAVVRTVPVTNFVGKLVMTRGVVSFDALDFDLYGGRVSATGTVLDLPAESTGYTLKLKIKEMDLGAVLKEHTSLDGVIAGRLSPELDVNGKGLAWSDLVKTLDGPAIFQSSSLTVTTLDLLGPIGEPLKKAMSAATTFKIAGTPKASEGTTLKDLFAMATFKGGKMQLKKPVDVDTPHGKLHLDGAAYLDKRLDFIASLDMQPDTVAMFTGGKFKPKKAIPVPMKIGGTWDHPSITGVDVSQIVAALMAELGGKYVDQAVDAAADKVSDVVGDKLPGAAGDQVKDAIKGAADPKKAAEEAKKLAEAAAKKKADETKKKAEDAAKKKAAEAKKQAEEKAKKALGGIFK